MIFQTPEQVGHVVRDAILFDPKNWGETMMPTDSLLDSRFQKVSSGESHENTWQVMLDVLDQFSNDTFEGRREQPTQQTRVELEGIFAVPDRHTSYSKL